MPIIKSAKKRVKTAEKAAIRNSKTKRTMRTALKAFHKAVTGGEQTAETHAAAQSNIDKAAKKGLIHKNKAARQKAQLARVAKAAASAAPVKKTAAKKPVASKAAPAKKASVAKAPAKSTVAKPSTKASAKKPTAQK